MTAPPQHPDPSDGAVIGASLTEPSRFALVFDRHAPAIHRYLARRLGAQAADDLVGETFLTAFGVRARFDRDRPDARPWLYGIATNVTNRHTRAEAREFRLRQALHPEPHDPGPADRVAAGVTARAEVVGVGDALRALSPGDRDVLLLFAWEQLGYEEIAAALAIPVGTVRSRLNRARRKVRAAFGAPDIPLQEASRG